MIAFDAIISLQIGLLVRCFKLGTPNLTGGHELVWGRAMGYILWNSDGGPTEAIRPFLPSVQTRPDGYLPNYTRTDIDHFATAEREPSSATSADRGAAVETSDLDGPGDKVRDPGVEILRSCSNSFGCWRVSGLVYLAEWTDGLDPKRTQSVTPAGKRRSNSLRRRTRPSYSKPIRLTRWACPWGRLPVQGRGHTAIRLSTSPADWEAGVYRQSDRGNAFLARRKP